MRRNDIVLASAFCSLCVTSLFLSGVRAADGTQLVMEGQILDTPCSIDPGSRDQSINMGASPVSLIAHDRAGRVVPFAIRLRDCVLERVDSRLADWKGFAITFDGVSDGADFAVSAPAKGVALRIRDIEGNRAVPGEPLPEEMLVQGDQTLNFTLQLVADGHPLEKGTYQSVIHFGLSYY